MIQSLVISNDWRYSALEEVPDYLKDAFRAGYGNGYVILPKFHPWFGLHYNDIPVEIHGGLTFSDKITEELIETWAKSKAREKELDKKLKANLGLWMIGFDTIHYGDNEENWPKEAVEEETKRLKRQCEKAYVDSKPVQTLKSTKRSIDI